VGSDPPEDFTHPATASDRDSFSDQRPGFEDQPPSTADMAKDAEEAARSGMALPPRSKQDLPTSSLADRIRKRLQEGGR
jgi:hypothetical protein